MLPRRRRDGGARLQPDARAARLRAGRLGARDQHGRPPVPGRLRLRRARLPGDRRAAAAAPDRGHRARGRRAHPHRARPARRDAPRVGHALRPRPAALRRRADRARGRGPGHADQRPRRRARLPGDARARRGDDEAGPRGRVALRARRGRGGRRLPGLAAARRVRVPRRARVRLQPGGHHARPRLRAGHPRRGGEVRVLEAGRRELRRAAVLHPPQRARRRPAAGRQGQRPGARAPARADGLHRRPPRRRERRDHRDVPADRPLHDQGVRRAGLRDAAAGPQAAPVPGGPRADRGLARLQGGRRAVRHVPQGRAVRGAGGRPAGRGPLAARARGHRARAAARAPRRRRAQRLADPDAAARALRRRAGRARPRAVPAPLRDLQGRDAPRARRQRPLAGALPRPRARRAARAGAARAGGGGHRALAHVGRRAARPADRAPGPGRRPPARGGLAAPLPRPLQGLHVGRLGRARHRLLRPPRRGRGPRRLAAAARRADPRQPVQGGREGRAVRGDADARGPRPARDRGALDAADGRGGRGLGAGVPRARARRRAARRRGARRRRGRGGRGRLARRRRERPAQPARRDRGPGPPAARRAARLPQVPPAGRLALHRGLPERRAGGQLQADGQARALLRGALRPLEGARRGRRDGAARGDPRRPGGRGLARPRPHPAQPAVS